MLVLFIYFKKLDVYYFLTLLVSACFIIFYISVLERELKSMYDGVRLMRWLEIDMTALLMSGKASVRYVVHSWNSVFCILVEKLLNIFK